MGLKQVTLLLFFCITIELLHAQQPEMLVQLGHSDRVRCAEISSRGDFIVTGGNDHQVKLWQRSTGLLVRTFTGHKGIIYDVKISADGKDIYSCSWDDKRMLRWDASTGTVKKQYYNATAPVTSMALDPSGKWLACIAGNKVLIMQSSDFRIQKEIAVPGASLVQFDEQGKRIYITSAEYSKEKLFIYTLASSELKASVNLIYSPVSCVIKGSTVLVCNYEELVLINLLTGTHIYSQKKTTQKFSAASLTEKADRILYGTEDGSLFVADVAGQPVVNKEGVVLTIEKKHTGIINNVRFSNDGNYILSASNDWSAKVFSMATGKMIRDLSSRSEFVQSISLNGTGKYLAFASGHLQAGNHIGVWDLAKGKLLPFYESQPPSDFFSSVSFSKKNKNILASGYNAKTYWYAFPDNGNAYNISIGDAPVTCAVLTPNGKNGVAGTKDGKILIWRPDRNKSETVDVDKQGIASVDISADAAMIAMGTYDGKVLVYGYESKALLISLASHTASAGYEDTSMVMAYGSMGSVSLGTDFKFVSASVMSVAFSPDGKYLASAGGNWIKLFRVADGKLVQHIRQYGAGFGCVAFSADSKTLSAGGADFCVRAYDVETGNLKYQFAGHQNEVRSVQFSNDGKFLISGSLDTQIKIWDLLSGKESLSYIVLQGGKDFVITNPQGYYYASKGASSILSFRVGNEIYPFSQFDLKYNRPDIILTEISRFAYGDAKDNPNVPLIRSLSQAYQKRLARQGFTASQLGSDFHVPQVQVNTAQLSLSTRSSTVSFTVQASDALYELSQVRVFVNEVPAFGIRGIPVQGKNAVVPVTIALSNERNHITVSCINTKGAESYRESFDMIYEGGVVTSKVYYIGIGVSNYKDPDFNLKYSVKDVDDMSKTILSKYPDATIRVLSNENATREKILALKEVLMKTSVNDKVILSLSGHGILSKDLDFYYATYDMDFKDPGKRGLLYEDLEDLLDGIPARNKILLVDACHSGEVDKTGGVQVSEGTAAAGVNGVAARGAQLIADSNGLGLENSFELMQEVFSDINQGNGAFVISAAGGKEYALESDQWNNGVFTYSVINGLARQLADENRDGHVTVSELKNYVSAEVQKLTAGKQKPTSRRENTENDWILW